MPKPYSRHMPARPFKPKQRALWLPLLALAAIIGMALFFFMPPSKSFDGGRSAVPVTAADALGIKDWTPVSGEIDSGDKYLEFTYGNGPFNQVQVIGLKGKFTLDGKYASWDGKGFYRVQIPVFNQRLHATLAIDATKNAKVTTSSDAPQPMRRWSNIASFPNPQNAAEAIKSNSWSVTSGYIYLRDQTTTRFPVTPVVSGGPTECEGASIPVRAMILLKGFTYYWVQCLTEENGRKTQGNRLEGQAILDSRLFANIKNIFNNASILRELMD